MQRWQFTHFSLSTKITGVSSDIETVPLAKKKISELYHNFFYFDYIFFYCIYALHENANDSSPPRVRAGNVFYKKLLYNALFSCAKERFRVQQSHCRHHVLHEVLYEKIFTCACNTFRRSVHFCAADGSASSRRYAGRLSTHERTAEIGRASCRERV